MEREDIDEGKAVMGIRAPEKHAFLESLSMEEFMAPKSNTSANYSDPIHYKHKEMKRQPVIVHSLGYPPGTGLRMAP